MSETETETEVVESAPQTRKKARGEDEYKYHEYSNIPSELMGKNEIISQNNANKELSKIFYSGSKKIGKY